MEFVLQLAATLFIVYLGGHLINRFNLPNILGWIITAMFLGPNVLNIMTEELFANGTYQVIIMISTLLVGVTIGKTLLWEQLKSAGPQLIGLSLSELGTTAIISGIAFGIYFVFAGYPSEGLIAISILVGLFTSYTAPGPSSAVISDANADGPVSRTTPPLVPLNSVIATVTFFIILGIIESMYAEGSSSLILSLTQMLVIPIATSFSLGAIGSKINVGDNKKTDVIVFLSMLAVTFGILYFLNYHVYAKPSINWILVGIGYAAGYVNLVSNERRLNVDLKTSTLTGLGLILLITDLSAKTDPRAMITAAPLILFYVIIRFIGKFLGVFLGGKAVGADKNVQKFVGIQMYPHAGPVMSRLAAATPVIMTIGVEYLDLLVVIVPAAAILSDIIAIPLMNWTLVKAGEVGKALKNNDVA